MNIKKIILDDMPNDLDDLAKARYIYLKLADYVNFSTTFQNTNIDSMAKIYNTKVDIENISSNITCTMWAQIYSSLLNEVNISNEIVNEGHKYVRFLFNGKIWVADATYGRYTDLARIKYGDSTHNFGVALKQDKEASIYIDYQDIDNQ